MKNKNIAFIGFMGVGKTMVSNRLGAVLNRKILSTDQLIEQREGRKISEIFKENGESYFRGIESDIVKEVLKEKNIILDCGGGVVLNQKNLDLLKRTSVLICLTASVDFIYEMVKQQKHRPLLDVSHPKERIRELMEARNPFYKQAHYTISTENKTANQIVEEVLKILSDE